MAKTKHHRRKHHRKVGAMSLNPKSPLVRLAAVGVGYFFADSINTAIDTVIKPPATASTSLLDTGTLVTVGEVGIGTYLLMGKGKGSIIKTAAGGILAGAGLKRALKKFGIVTGYQNTPVIGRHMAGYQNTPVIGGIPSALSGIPSALSGGGFRVNGAPGYTPTGSGSKVMAGVEPTTGSGLTRDGGSDYMN